MRASLLHLQRARHPLRAEQRLALALLANVPRGVTQDLLLLAHGFDSDLIAELVHAGHARSRREIVEAGGPPIEIVRITITDAGRQARSKASAASRYVLRGLSLARVRYATVASGRCQIGFDVPSLNPSTHEKRRRRLARWLARHFQHMSYKSPWMIVSPLEGVASA